jgi:hypothetical protein
MTCKVAALGPTVSMSAKVGLALTRLDRGSARRGVKWTRLTRPRLNSGVFVFLERFHCYIEHGERNR